MLGAVVVVVAAATAAVDINCSRPWQCCLLRLSHTMTDNFYGQMKILLTVIFLCGIIFHDDDVVVVVLYLQLQLL